VGLWEYQSSGANGHERLGEDTIGFMNILGHTVVRSRWPSLTRVVRSQAHRVGMVVVLVLLWRSMSMAQSNEVYSFWTSASTPLTGYRVAVVSASPMWVVGSAQNRYGIEECRYWTDSAGRAIPWPATRVTQPGDEQHRYTRFRLWPASHSIPLPPMDLAFLAVFGALVFGFIPILHFARGRLKHHLRIKVRAIGKAS